MDLSKNTLIIHIHIYIYIYIYIYKGAVKNFKCLLA
jgi:hypothetical protein